MLLLQFSTSHYCRKARLALGYKQIPYQVENLTPGLHIFRVKPLSGRNTVPVLLPQQKKCPAVVADSTEIIRFLEVYQSNPPLYFEDDLLQQEALRLEDYFDESIGTATRFVYYQFRAHEGKYIDPSWMSQIVIAIVRSQYGINAGSAKLAAQRIDEAIALLSKFWQDGYLVGDRFSVADLAAAALLSPLGLIPAYRLDYPWLFERISEIHQLCHEPLPKNWEAGLRQVQRDV
ncbi:MAG: glutathione S-transferase family protein [Pseudanabaena sp.]|jgi:glutathione S-transferase|uniref:glutathione S-transferase family protein n=1 Tax=Pseudanabaena mucicola TaxID=71190 RepID=UPI0025776C81|nr:glutathione S-transferase family protein [Pseudanabaena mucicola]MCA6572870.1 glutathione S-transferase family protein [Pseudanabaena sp. M53BS1SP1A06MG]MCA6585829.1 glutathione S-transferase family protein [Pseudanabaena sp. M051S1SP1A06QC]MCA6587851.1 glutathione S-transferase family protein [Pseudanabaena sp. M109S1SP1A06QC]MCA6590642.1 glutathione S-transferase family protein [Pseudanabaena sp. M38BS1SP1A06MG]MCA6596264.1 glutathione S-transferase family protein [Pseudanabaena sp. M046S